MWFHHAHNRVKIPKTKYTAFLGAVQGSLAQPARQGLQNLLADRQAKRGKVPPFIREPYLLRARKLVAKPEPKPKRKKKKAEDKAKVAETEIVGEDLVYPKYVGDTSDEEDELPLCLLQLLEGEEDVRAPTTPDNITEHLSSSIRSHLKDDVPVQIKQTIRTSRERIWAKGVLRLPQFDTSRDLD